MWIIPLKLALTGLIFIILASLAAYDTKEEDSTAGCIGGFFFLLGILFEVIAIIDLIWSAF